METGKRMIYADALLTEVVKLQALEPDKAVAKIIMLITNAKTVDAVEVVHGRWERFKHHSGTHGIRCGICKELNGRKSNYCPNCGADMRERKNDER